ncbi:NCSEB-like protein [Mya arenaria]|uniref:Neutral ceramidase n=1 Tax=Mya arenaria TaxID=6604 RepID=A0ABY7DF24_MYAAR|nr:NCSEB-like protein [Mya arenaria]
MISVNKMANVRMKWIVCCTFLLSILVTSSSAQTDYNVGIGIADITGPAAEVNMMGYANPAQTSRGIHLRQFSRAFIFEDNNKNRVVFINIDACMFSAGVKLEVNYGGKYTERNVCISGTHTHSGPAGFHQYLLFDITSMGFSIDRAESKIRPANLYKYDTDKEMTVLRIVDAEGKPFGMISWFAVHCTSMNNTNRLISSDNKGLAELMFEAEMNGEHVLPGKGDFVAAFAQANEGDVSPNTQGPHCLDTGLRCDFNKSTCNGRELFDSAFTKLTGPVDFRHTYTNMTDQTLPDGKRTCKGAMGYSFAAGTTDGPGAFNFAQSTTSPSPVWNFVSHLLKNPSKAQIECHHPKPILLDTGEMDFPYAWEPAVVDTQILRIGQMFLIAVPAEFTTMSGRRTRDAVVESLKSAGLQVEPIPIIAGLSNDYADYVTTFEEYQEQRYEGGSTIYGPHTLEAYINVFRNLSKALVSGSPVAPGPNPPDLVSKQVSFLPPVILDRAPLGKSYAQGDRVEVKFVGANPRNNLRVDYMVNSTAWETVYTDAHWQTQFHWESAAFFESVVTIYWDIPSYQKPGMYRVSYFCDHKELGGGIQSAQGTSSTFKVTNSQEKMAMLNKKWEKKKTILERINKALKGKESKSAQLTNLVKPK